MKALILGAYGFLGIHLCSYLESKGFCVIRSGKSDTAFIKYFHRSGSTNLLPIIQDVRPDIIINLIALTNVDLCEKDPRQAYDLNTDLPAHLKSSITQLGITPLVIHISTDQVYYGKGPHNEQSNIKPINIYSTSKLFGEFNIEADHTLILRTNFVGMSLKANGFSFSDWIVESLESKKKINGYYDIFFSPLHVTSLCDFIIKAIENRMTGLYNLGCNKGISKFEFMINLCEELKLDRSLITRTEEIINPQRARRPKDMRLDSGKFHENTGIMLPSIDDEICKLANDYKQR